MCHLDSNLIVFKLYILSAVQIMLKILRFFVDMFFISTFQTAFQNFIFHDSGFTCACSCCGVSRMSDFLRCCLSHMSDSGGGVPNMSEFLRCCLSRMGDSVGGVPHMSDSGGGVSRMSDSGGGVSHMSELIIFDS